MARQTQFRHQDIAVPPEGTKVRTIHAGDHELRIAFPKGARKKGSGTLVSILHPLTEKNPSCGGVLQLAAGELSTLTIPVEAAGNGFGRDFEAALDETAAQNPSDWREAWTHFREKLGKAIAGHGTRDTGHIENPKEKTFVAKWRYRGKGKGSGGTLEVQAKSVKEAKQKLEGLLRINEHGEGILGKVQRERNPAARNLDQIEDAAKVAEDFNGVPPAEVREIDLPSKRRDDFAHFAWVEQLVFHPTFDTTRPDYPAISKAYFEQMEKDVNPVKAWEKVAAEHGVVMLVFDVKGDEIELAATGFKGEGTDVHATQLALIGGQQEQFRKVFDLFRTATDHDSVDLGELASITYATEKVHLGDKGPRSYYHVFAEENGDPPRASFDMLNNRIELTGGSYRLNEAERGIIN